MHRLRRVALGLLVLTSLAGILVIGAVRSINLPPRTLGRYIEDRLAGHDQALSGPGLWLARALIAADRGRSRAAMSLTLTLGAQMEAAPVPGTGEMNVVSVRSAEEVLRAIAQAQPGDLITLEPGVYRFSASSILVTRPGTRDSVIVVRALRPRTVLLEMDNSEGFVVSAPHWRFENLTVRGVCKQHSECDHAFHVVGGASDFVARNNTLIDFNAHIKVNGQRHRFPDRGLIEGNTLTNTAPRQTDRPVVPFDLVAASEWVVRENIISDFVKAEGDRVSYGAFVKGGGTGNRLERNLVLCEDRLRDTPGSRVGLSLGGGGSGNAGDFCRDSACAIEQQGGAITSNLIAFCSDDGIYVNRGANSHVLGNTLIDTGGIVVRFAESAAEVEGNLVDGSIRSRDGAALHAVDNLSSGVAALYLGRHPQRELFRDALSLDLAWAAAPPMHAAPGRASPDLCKVPRPVRPVYGAFEAFAACVVARSGSPSHE